uniref:hypothetical protein n=1 Tax=Prevotella sp. TaxID=59823 RepID=UPI003FEED7D6
MDNKNVFFDKNGVLNLDEAVMDIDSFKTIMADGIVTDEELKAQSDRVIGILHDMEKRYSPEQLKEIKQLLAETAVLYAIYNYHSIQSVK